jgi:hypothetical protein
MKLATGLVLGVLVLGCNRPRARELTMSPALRFESQRDEAPSGYGRATVLKVVPTEQGSAVLLVDEDEQRVLPIFVGGTEALTIHLRLNGETYQRPLTHDLLTSLVKELGATPVRAHVDELRGTTYVGSVFVRHAGRLIKLDARPSDAIAFALGAKIPIYAARDVMKTSGIPREELEGKSEESLGKKRRGDPISL